MIGGHGRIMRVTGIGQCSWDYLGTIESFPSSDTKVEILNWQEQGGGPVATALVALARLGVSCRFFGIAGDDTQGELIRESLLKEGVDTEGLLIRSNSTSQTAFIAVEKQCGKRTIFWKRPTGEPMRKEELGCDFLDGADFLHLDGLMGEVSLDAAREARKRSVPVMVDAGRMRPGMLELAQNCDYVVASEQFAADIEPDWENDYEAYGRQLDRLGLANVTITLGERGSVTFQDTRVIRIPAFEVQTIDTTGAGDVFHGGFIFGLLQGWSIEDTIRFASATAALKCTKVGGRSGIPALDETLRFLAERGFKIRA
jgi:sulfofructose kinase